MYGGDGLQLEGDGMIPGTIHQGRELKVTRDNEETFCRDDLCNCCFPVFTIPILFCRGRPYFDFIWGFIPIMFNWGLYRGVLYFDGVRCYSLHLDGANIIISAFLVPGMFHQGRC